MGNIGNGARFINDELPLGQGNKLSDQEAWDVATFVYSHERPQNPRFISSVVEAGNRFYGSQLSMYGREMDGLLLGKNSPPAGP